MTQPVGTHREARHEQGVVGGKWDGDGARERRTSKC